MLSLILWPAVAVIISLTTFLTLSKPQQATIRRRLGLARRASRPSTPSLEKQGTSSSKPLASSATDLATAFPPSVRAQLRELHATLPAAQQAALGELDAPFDPASATLLGFEADYRTAPAGAYTPTGLAVREVRALLAGGGFPDYAALSGVPAPAPYPEFEVERARPRPYRPFRWAYHQTMSLTKLEPDWWIELESTYRQRIAQRKALYAAHGRAVLAALPGSELACRELMEMVVAFVCARYPQYFSLSADRSVLTNRILGTTAALRGEQPQQQQQHPLEVLLDHVPEDFGIVLRDPATGLYVFRAGVICSALGWNVASKIGLPLHEIHRPVPDYAEKMQFSMDRFFSKLPTHKPIQRGSWGLEIDQPLYMPPGDAHESLRQTQDPALDPARLHLRVDWQTLRRLPLSGAVVFNFKALFTPLAALRAEARVPALAARVLRGGKAGLLRYKGTWHVEHLALPLLERFDREQRARGLVPPAWEPRTLDESPWFPGWEAQWHAQQGF
ncbi:alpha-1,2-mannosyltransferase [Xylariomycetidae sp. FL0641]|nr:alpha-1,2-mannosyltransferase [Xylariomycetidae sp. FL0641]